MISCTLQSLPAWNLRNVLPEGSEPSTSSTFQASKPALGVWRERSAGASFAKSPNGSYSSHIVLATARRKCQTGGKPMRSLSITSQESSCIVNRALLQSGDGQLNDGRGRSSGSLGVSHLLQMDRSLGLNSCRSRSKEDITRGRNRSKIISRGSVDAGSETEYCDRSHDQPHGACSFRRSSSPSSGEGTKYVDVPEGSDSDRSGYTIKVSKELMGVFRYVEKVKRARIKELSTTLKQTAAACMFFSFVRGILGPLMEVFQTQPPSWGRLILMLSAFDSFAITYLALKASEPLEKLSMLATESSQDIMGSIEKEEEHMLTLAVELVKLFRRLRNIAVATAVAQFASLVHSFLHLNNPKLVSNAGKIIGAWLNTPWN